MLQQVVLNRRATTVVATALASVAIAVLTFDSPAVILALAFGAVVLVRPRVGLYAFIIGRSTELALIRGLEISASAVTTACYASLVLGSLGSILRWLVAGQVRTSSMMVRPLLAVGVVAGPGMIMAVSGDTSFAVVLAASALLLAPLLGLTIGAWTTTPSAWRSLLILMIVSLTLNVLAGLYELQLGQDGLLSLGLQYGTNVRDIDGVLRVPGLTLFNANAGMFAGAVAVVLTWEMKYRRAALSRPVIFIGLGMALALILITTSRTALILAAAGSVAIAFSGGSGVGSNTIRRARSTRLLIVLLMAGLIIVFIQYGAGSSTSLVSRVAVWTGALGDGVAILGRGLGAVGAARSSSLAGPSVQPAYIDNYWLSIVYQFGWWGIAFALVCVGVLLAQCKRAVDTGARAALVGVISAIAVSALFIEAWEYTLGMVVLLQLVCASSADPVPAVSMDSASRNRAELT